MRPRPVGAIEAAGLSAVAASTLGVLRDHLQLRAGERVLVRCARSCSPSSRIDRVVAVTTHTLLYRRPSGRLARIQT